MQSLKYFKELKISEKKSEVMLQHFSKNIYVLYLLIFKGR